MLNNGGNGMYLFGCYSTDGLEFSIYIGPYRYTYTSPVAEGLRLDGKVSCALTSNNIRTLTITNPTSGKSYIYYALKIGILS
jgi:hypothetical protein